MDRSQLAKQSKAELIAQVLAWHDRANALHEAMAEKDQTIAELRAQLAQSKRKEHDQKTKEANRSANEPSSKKPEWDKDGNPKPPKSADRERRKRKKRPGCGNKRKTREPDHTNITPLEHCPGCDADLGKRSGCQTGGRIVEDIESPAEATVVSREIEVLKWCSRCKKMMSSKTEKALPGSDIGLNAAIKIAYLWVMCALPLTKIRMFFLAFHGLTLSTAGMSKMMIRLANIMTPIADEILKDVKLGTKIWADETGWRVKGKLWWLWVFGNKDSAYYWADKCRGAPVVEKILGNIFYGVLIVDAWSAYNQLICEKQTCMAHIFRKIRKFIDAFPEYRTLMQFYLILRRIIRAGETLQGDRSTLTEAVFQGRLTQLHLRLDELLRWRNPNPVLKEIIKKVKRQRPNILTFVEHEGAESHNNHSEFLIKIGVLKRKVSGGSMSEKGARAYACLQSIAMTCQLRKISFHLFMKESLVHYIRTGTPMLLSQYKAKIEAKARIKPEREPTKQAA